MAHQNTKDPLVAHVQAVRRMVLRWKERRESQKELLASPEGQQQFLRDLDAEFAWCVDLHWERWRFDVITESFEDDDRNLPWKEHDQWLLWVGRTRLLEQALCASRGVPFMREVIPHFACEISMTPAEAAYRVLTHSDALARWWASLLRHPMEAVRNLAKLLLGGTAADSTRLYQSLRAALPGVGPPATEICQEICVALCEALSEWNPGLPVVGGKGSLVCLTHEKLGQIRESKSMEVQWDFQEGSRDGIEFGANAKSPEDVVAQEEERQFLDELLPKTKLSSREREFIELQRAGLTQEEIADKKGIQRGTVGKTMQSAIRKLQVAAKRAGRQDFSQILP